MQNPDDWRYDGVYLVKNVGLMSGYGDGRFGVDDSLSVVQLLTILWRYSEPEASFEYDASSTVDTSGLVDVDDYQYYTGAVNWAVSNGVVSGYETPQGRFLDPHAPISTERAMTIIANMLDSGNGMTNQQVDAILRNFVDRSQISDWARQSVAWSVESGIVNGYEMSNGAREIRPQEHIPRGRFAVILANAIETGVLPPNTPGII